MILCCGEALIDMLPRETIAGEPAFAPYAGGAVFNTAIALGRLDCEPGFFCPLSSDLFGEMLVEKLADANASIDLSPRPDAPTTLAFVRLQDGHATYTFYDENSALTSLRDTDLPALPDNVDALFFGGISLAAGPSAAAFQTLLEREGAQRATMIDPNIRPSFIKDRDDFVARIHAMMRECDVVKLSDEDLHWLEGEGDIATLAQGIITRGTKLVLITQGAEGVTGYMADKRVFEPSQRVEVVDTVGAGDTFNAGFLASLQDNDLLSKDSIQALTVEQLKDALNMGARCAAVTVSRAGANPPKRSEL